MTKPRDFVDFGGTRFYFTQNKDNPPYFLIDMLEAAGRVLVKHNPERAPKYTKGHQSIGAMWAIQWCFEHLPTTRKAEIDAVYPQVVKERAEPRKQRELEKRKRRAAELDELLRQDD